MPQSVKDRLNDTTEAVFHLVRSKRYWYDLDAIREPHCDEVEKALEKIPNSQREESKGQIGTAPDRNDSGGDYVGDNNAACDPAGKNPGDVFEVTTKPFPDAHFAVYPPELCEKPIKATCPPTVCTACGSPYEREVEVSRGGDPNRDRSKKNVDGVDGNPSGVRSISGDTYQYPNREFKGWTPTCDCDTDATEAGIALDPFAGAGTTLLKAKELGRRFVGIELNPEYADMARARIGLSPNDPANVRGDDAQQGFEAYTDGGDRE
jgi:hypothetical protein